MGAYIREIFSSVQGEGPYIGCRQVFIRFEGCNLSCRYCDTVGAGENKACSVEVKPGAKSFIELVNPISAQDVISIVKKYFPVSLQHSASITGGEPLLQADFLEDLLPRLRQEGIVVYLETNGSLPEKLERVVDHIDIIAMDIKLPGTSGCPPIWDKHLRFLRIAKHAGVFVKIVMDDFSSLQEYNTALEILGSVDKGITLVIQPVTVNGKCALSPDRALDFQTIALKSLNNVRIIPQAHIMMNQL